MLTKLKCDECSNEKTFYSLDTIEYDGDGKETAFYQGEEYQCRECDTYITPQYTKEYK